jgi:hypothetical protein
MGAGLPLPLCFCTHASSAPDVEVVDPSSGRLGAQARDRFTKHEPLSLPTVICNEGFAVTILCIVSVRTIRSWSVSRQTSVPVREGRTPLKTSSPLPCGAKRRSRAVAAPSGCRATSTPPPNGRELTSESHCFPPATAPASQVLCCGLSTNTSSTRQHNGQMYGGNREVPTLAIGKEPGRCNGIEVSVALLAAKGCASPPVAGR